MSSIITVVRDPQHALGKCFTRKPDGSVSKSSSVNVSFGIAVMHQVNNHEDLAKLLKTVGEETHAAIINASFDGIEVGETFAILSEREIEKRLNIPRADRQKQKGVHHITHDGQPMKAIGRFKDNVRPSGWQIIDRDIDCHTPAQYADMSFEEWLEALSPILPRVNELSYVQAPSTSTRVMVDGKAIGSGNGHMWIKVASLEDVERIRAALIVLAVQAGITWLKPRFSRDDPAKVVGHSLTTIVDPSVWTPGRLVFVGKPVVGEGMMVEPLSATAHKGQHDLLDTSAITLPDAKTVRDITRKAGVEMEMKPGNGLGIITHDLTLNTEIDTEDLGVLTVREILERGITSKVRCQTPFRDSSSYAAFLSVGKDGTPFVYDVGTGTTHWLNERDAGNVRLAISTGVITRLLPKVKDDCGAPLETDAIHALSVIQQQNPSQFLRVRSELKQANKQVSLTAINSAIKAHAMETETAPTHHGYAKNLIAQMTCDKWAPVGYEGSLYVVDPASGLWVRQPIKRLERAVAEANDGKDNCTKRADYSAIAQHAISLVDDDTFFADIPVGLACPDGFYQIKGNEVTVVELSPDHRQRVMLSFTPKKQDTPLFDAFLHETFMSNTEGEEEQQCGLVQEMAGAIMLGLMPRFQKAIQFYDPFGRAGKGTLERILRELVPSSFVTAVSPFVWHKEYFVAALAGTRFNVVGELPDNESIPAAHFKTVLGGDLITGRHPTHRPITFKNEAAHLFMSNHLINTRDHSEAFFARWLIVEFPNSRLRTGLPLDPMLAPRIIEQDLAGIAQWALEGAIRLMNNGSFSKSAAHDRLMTQWRRSTNSLEEFIHERCKIGNDSLTTRRSEFYSEYSEWCRDSGRKPFSKGRAKELLEHNVGLGITLTKINGYEIFRGVKVESDTEDAIGHLVKGFLKNPGNGSRVPK
ncbi:MAG: phage/plasmid primase, P4 family [Rugosibacter sp.]|nr:phage/plasmid primase, P4 family [Rugosibacter sp.]